MLFTSQVNWENAVNLLKGKSVSYIYRFIIWSRSTYLKIVLNLDSAWAQIVLWVVELVNAVQVCIGRQVDLWLIVLVTLFRAMCWRTIHGLKGVSLHQNVVRLAPLEFANPRAYCVMRPSFLVLNRARRVDHFLRVVTIVKLAFFMYIFLLSITESCIFILRLLLGELIGHVILLRV